MPDARDRISRAGKARAAVAAVYAGGQQAQYGVAVFFIVEDHAFDRAGKLNSFRVLQKGQIVHGCGLPLLAGFAAALRWRDHQNQSHCSAGSCGF